MTILAAMCSLRCPRSPAPRCATPPPPPALPEHCVALVGWAWCSPPWTPTAMWQGCVRPPCSFSLSSAQPIAATCCVWYCVRCWESAPLRVVGFEGCMVADMASTFSTRNPAATTAYSYFPCILASASRASNAPYAICVPLPCLPLRRPPPLPLLRIVFV